MNQRFAIYLTSEVFEKVHEIHWNKTKFNTVSIRLEVYRIWEQLLIKFYILIVEYFVGL